MRRRAVAVVPEVSAPQGSRGRLGLALRDIRVELLERQS